jgi:hypothetical protein
MPGKGRSSHVFELTLCLAAIVLLVVLINSYFKPYGSERTRGQKNIMQHTTFGQVNYREQMGRFLPASNAVVNGKALFSWRVTLLPFIEHNDLYEQLKLDEPWDSAHNKPLLSVPYPIRANPFELQVPPDATHIQGFVGPGTALECPGLTERDFPDGLATTIFAVEARDSVPWAKPADLPYDPYDPIPPLGCLSHYPSMRIGTVVMTWRSGFHASFMDGSVRFFSSNIDEEVLRALITRNGGERIDALPAQPEVNGRLH